jgi:branched-chain amino acid transport system permease protein
VTSSVSAALALIGGRELLQQAVNGLFTGSIYALFAVGYTLVFGVLDVLNLAHSAVFMVGAVIALMLTADLGWPFWLAAPAAIAVCGALGYALERFAFRPLRRQGAPHLNALITSVGLALVMVSITQVRFGANARAFPPGTVPATTLRIAGVRVDTVQLATVTLTLALMGGLALVVRRTSAGRAMRAVAENARAAMLRGIDVDKVFALTLVLSSALGGLAGILFGLTQSDVSPFMGRDEVELKGLAVIVVGGMGSIAGAVLAGYLLGLVEVVALVLFGANIRVAVAFVVLFVVLVIRPRGLIGERLMRRA